MNEWKKTRGEDSLTLSPNLINIDNVRFATHMSITLYKGILSIPMVLCNDYEINTEVLTLLIKRYLRQHPKYNDNIFYCRREIIVVNKPRKNNKKWTTPIEIHLRVNDTPSVEDIEEIIKEIVRLSNEEICSYIDDMESDTLYNG